MAAPSHKGPSRIIVPKEAGGVRLDQFLSQAFAISKGAARRAIINGAVYVNRKRVRVASRGVTPGAAIEVHLQESAPVQAAAVTAQTLPNTLFQDAHILGIDKPPGLPTQPTLDNARFTAFEAAKRIMREQFEKSGRASHEVYVGLHHRLDRDTSGVLIFTTSKEANPGIARAFQDHLAQKTYVALVARKPGARTLARTFSVQNFLKARKLSGKKTRVESVASGGDAAHTDFKILREWGDALLIEARPRTGRMHQIRVHLSELGYPLLGDVNYGGPTEWKGRAIPRCLLHAQRLELPHPLTGAPLVIESPLPQDFQDVVSALGGGPGRNQTV